MFAAANIAFDDATFILLVAVSKLFVNPKNAALPTAIEASSVALASACCLAASSVVVAPVEIAVEPIVINAATASPKGPGSWANLCKLSSNLASFACPAVAVINACPSSPLPPSTEVASPATTLLISTPASCAA